MIYLIWSFDNNGWWRPNRQGYTPMIEEAGRYGATEAGEIVTNSIFLDEVAIAESLAIPNGPPKFHPYGGEEMVGEEFNWER